MTCVRGEPAILLLEDGTVFRGRGWGAPTTICGELCFTTAMTGYQEAFTDPSYYQQFLVLTHVHIGNYGVCPEEAESRKIYVSGAIIRDLRPVYSRSQAMDSLAEWFAREGKPILTGVDTRSLIQHIRTRGAMRAILSTETTDLSRLRKILDEFPPMAGRELASEVSAPEPYVLGNPGASLRIAVLDFGVKFSILRNLMDSGAFVRVFPARSSAEEVLTWNPDGIVLSNGPGDPAAMDYAIELTRAFLDARIPIMGICLGHQLLALALGFSTFKMHHGHRGINHAVWNAITSTAQITSQNHGFCVDPDSGGDPDVVFAFWNLNDQTTEGMYHRKLPVFSVQFHPEAGPGPHDSFYLFDAFFQMVERGLSPESAIRECGEMRLQEIAQKPGNDGTSMEASCFTDSGNSRP